MATRSDPRPGVRPGASTLAVLAAVVLIAGANPVAIRFSNKELPAFWGAGIRFAAASLLLFAIARVMRLPVPRGAALAGTLLWGLGTFGFFALVYVALRHIGAGLAAPIIASVPLITFVLAIVQRIEPFHVRGLAGGLTSVAGIAVLSAGGVGGAPVKYLLFILAASACAAEATIVVQRFPKVHPIMMNAIAMGLAGAFLLAISFGVSEHHAVPSATKTWLALAWLVVFGSLVLFVLMVILINRWSAMGAAYQFVLFPMVTVFLSAWIDHERITRSLVSGAVLVVLGVYVGAIGGHRSPKHDTAPAPALPQPVPPC